MQGVENKRTYELNEEEINRIRDEVSKYTTEADLVSPASAVVVYDRHLLSVQNTNDGPCYVSCRSVLCHRTSRD